MKANCPTQQFRPAFALAVILLAVCQTLSPPAIAQESGALSVQERIRRGKAVFEEKCRTVAGEKIYRKVENVEGLLLMKVRPQAGAREWADPMWSGAAFARESTGDEFITSFLGYEEGGSTFDGTPTPVTPRYRGSINTNRNPGGIAGYRWVEVVDEKDGRPYRYVLVEKDVTRTSSILIGGDGRTYTRRETVLDRRPSTKPAPRYGVTYEDNVNFEERALGIASSTIKVLDLKTNEMVGEMIRYAWSPGTPSHTNPSPWLTAYRCPTHARGTDAATRKFVDQVLIPAKAK